MLHYPAARRFQLILIKPSHYDDDGFVIRWWRAMSPANSLATVYAIAADLNRNRWSRASKRHSICPSVFRLNHLIKIS